jgi:outer membrane receptor protein involved in Fe transport
LSESLVRFLTSASSRTLANRLADQEKTIDLEGITVAASRINEAENISRVYGKGDVVIIPGEKFPIGGANDIFSYIQGKIAGVQIGIGADGTAAVSIRGAAQSSFSGGGTPLVLLDNIPVQLNDLFSIPLNMVASIEVFKDPASTGIFGVTGANGVLAVYTKRGGALYEKSPGITTFNYSGYSMAREFYQPNYDKPDASHNQGDTRSTIYWNPNLQVNPETGKAGFSFFNNDISDRLRVSIQGWDPFGRPVYFSKVFEKE